MILQADRPAHYGLFVQGGVLSLGYRQVCEIQGVGTVSLHVRGGNLSEGHASVIGAEGNRELGGTPRPTCVSAASRPSLAVAVAAGVDQHVLAQAALHEGRGG